jgi:hypothetical protein
MNLPRVPGVPILAIAAGGIRTHKTLGSPASKAGAFTGFATAALGIAEGGTSRTADGSTSPAHIRAPSPQFSSLYRILCFPSKSRSCRPCQKSERQNEGRKKNVSFCPVRGNRTSNAQSPRSAPSAAGRSRKRPPKQKTRPAPCSADRGSVCECPRYSGSILRAPFGSVNMRQVHRSDGISGFDCRIVL